MHLEYTDDFAYDFLPVNSDDKVFSEKKLKDWALQLYLGKTVGNRAFSYGNTQESSYFRDIYFDFE